MFKRPNTTYICINIYIYLYIEREKYLDIYIEKYIYICIEGGQRLNHCGDA